MPIANRMFNPLITGVLIIAYRDADRIISHPDTVTINIEIIDTVAVHGVITVIVRYNVRIALVAIHIHFIYACTISGYQYFLIVESFYTGNTDIFQTGIELDSLMDVHVVQIKTFLEGTDKEFTTFFMKI